MQVDCVGPGPREQECGARGRQGKSLDSPVGYHLLKGDYGIKTLPLHLPSVDQPFKSREKARHTFRM